MLDSICSSTPRFSLPALRLVTKVYTESGQNKVKKTFVKPNFTQIMSVMYVDESRGGYGCRNVGGGGGGGGGYGRNQSLGGGSGYQGGDRTGGRDGDWLYPSPCCGNSNFARRQEYNKCGTSNPGGEGIGGDHDGGARTGGSRSDRGGGGYGGNRCGGSYGGRRDSSYGGSEGSEDAGYGQAPPPLQPPPQNQYGTPPSYGAHNAVPRPNSYAPSYGPPPRYGGDGASARGPHGGNDGGYPSATRNSGYAYAPAPAEVTGNIKQCDEHCNDTCDNSRIYISNLPPDVSTDELKELFGGIGQVASIEQKRDQWPHNIKIYTDDSGKSKGDAVLSYEDPSDAHSAEGFYNNHDMRGYKIGVAMAEKSAPRNPTSFGKKTPMVDQDGMFPRGVSSQIVGSSTQENRVTRTKKQMVDQYAIFPRDVLSHNVGSSSQENGVTSVYKQWSDPKTGIYTYREFHPLDDRDANGGFKCLMFSSKATRKKTPMVDQDGMFPRGVSSQNVGSWTQENRVD